MSIPLRHEVKLKVDNYKNKLLNDTLLQCTEEQQDFFNNKVFPHGVPEDSYYAAIDLIGRSLDKNKPETESK